MAADSSNPEQNESEEEIARLKEELHELFEQHIKENEGHPLFASDIEDPEERAKWEARQPVQWNARHEILKKLVKLHDRKKRRNHR